MQEYWIVHPEEAILEVFMLHGAQYQLEKMYTRDGSVQVGIFDDLTIDLRDIFEEDFS